MITYFLAAALGWWLVIMSLMLLFRREIILSAMRDIMEQRGLMLVVGFITLIIGLLMVLSHNFWVLGWPVIITIFAWLILIAGLIRLACPDMVHKMWHKMVDKKHLFTIMGVILLIIGLFLLFQVYYA